MICVVLLCSLYSSIDKVDQTMADIQENMAVANEISEAISNPMGTGLEIDDVRPLYMILHVLAHKNHLDFSTG